MNNDTPETPANPPTLLSPWARVKQTVHTLIKGQARPGDQALLETIQECYEEASNFRSGGSENGVGSILSEWELAGNHYMGDHWVQVRHGGSGTERGFQVYYGAGEDTAGRGGDARKAVLNLTLNAILSNVEVQTSEPPTIRCQPAEIGEPPAYYLSTEGGKKLKETVDAARAVIDQEIAQSLAVIEGAEPDEAIYLEQQISDQQKQMEAMIPQMLMQQGLPVLTDEQMVNPHDPEWGPAVRLSPEEVGQVNALIANEMLRPEDLLEINDKACTKVAQQTWDHLFETAAGNQVMLKNELISNIFGNAVVMLQWHSSGPKAHTFSLSNESLISVWIDPTHDRIDESDYFGFDQVMSRDRARATYPELDEKQLDEAATSLDHAAMVLPYAASRSIRRAKTVMIRTCWLRHQIVPMTVAEALEAGLVSSSDVVGEDRRPMIDPDTGRKRVQYYLAGKSLKDGELEKTIEVKPVEQADHGTRWPDDFGLMQVTLIIGAKNPIISKIRCPYADINFGWNINIPRPDGSPYGMGEPKRLESISQQINRAAENLHRHLDRFRGCQMLFPSQLYKRLQAAGMQDLFQREYGIIPIPEETYTEIMGRGGVDRMIIQPPALPPASVQALQLFLSIHDKLSGNAPARQGQAPFSGIAAKTLESLKSAGEGPVVMRARWTEFMLERLFKLGLDSAVKWMPESRWMQINSGWSVSAMREILRRLEKAQYNVRASVVSGTGTAKTERIGEALTLRERGLLSRKSTMTLAGVENPEREDELILSEARDMMAPAPGTAPV